MVDNRIDVSPGVHEGSHCCRVAAVITDMDCKISVAVGDIVVVESKHTKSADAFDLDALHGCVNKVVVTGGH
jgi:hypothetical protein